jgi:HD-like signal output (HDOD) protein
MARPPGRSANLPPSFTGAAQLLDEQAVLSKVDAVGTVPAAVTRLFGLFGDERASMADYERVIRPDPSLTANLLHCANSAFYRGQHEISSVKEAISRVGTRRVIELAAGSTFAKTMPAKLPAYELEAAVFWKHSVAVAVLSDRIGREAGLGYPDLAFTAGLLHDLGKVLIGTYLASNPGALAGLPPNARLTDLASERALLGIDHAAAGEAMALKWALPKPVGAAARYHHSPADAPGATLRYLAASVHVADGMAHRAGYGTNGPEPVIDPAALEKLGLDQARLERLAGVAEAEIESTSQMLRGAVKR